MQSLIALLQQIYDDDSNYFYEKNNTATHISYFCGCSSVVAQIV